MELRHLRHFAAVVELGNLSKAADKVFISQPALTRSIKMLEEIVGATLIERRPRGVVPTPAGEALYQHAKLMLNEAARAKAEVKAVQSGARGTLSIGIAAMFADHIVDKAVAKICTGPSDVSISVTQGFLEDLVEGLRDGRLDLIFSNLGVGVLSGDVRVEPLVDVAAYVYAGASHPLAGAEFVVKEQLLVERWAVVDQPHMRDFLDRYFAVGGFPLPASMVRTNSLNLIRSLLSSGGFVGILPEHVVRLRSQRGEVVRLKAPDCPIVRKAGFITRASAPIRPILAQFMDEVRTACRDASDA